MRRLEARLGDLEQRSGAPRTSAAPTAAGSDEAVEPPLSSATPDPQATLPGLDADPAAVAPEVSGSGVVAGDLATERAAAAETPPVAPLATEPEPVAGVSQWEGRLGGTWLSRVGALLLFLGAGFFLKHAFEQEWIGAKGRVLAGLVAGAAMMAGGVRLAGSATYRRAGPEPRGGRDRGHLPLALCRPRVLRARGGAGGLRGDGPRDRRGLRDGAPLGLPRPRGPRDPGRASDAGHPRHRHRRRRRALHVPRHPRSRRAGPRVPAGVAGTRAARVRGDPGPLLGLARPLVPDRPAPRRPGMGDRVLPRLRRLGAPRLGERAVPRNPSRSVGR